MTMAQWKAEYQSDATSDQKTAFDKSFEENVGTKE